MTASSLFSSALFYWSVGPYGDVDDSLSKQTLMKDKPSPYFDLCFGKRPAEELYVLKNDQDQARIWLRMLNSLTYRKISRPK
jgi:hypothetical protein